MPVEEPLTVVISLYWREGRIKTFAGIGARLPGFASGLSTQQLNDLEPQFLHLQNEKNSVTQTLLWVFNELKELRLLG